MRNWRSRRVAEYFLCAKALPAADSTLIFSSKQMTDKSPLQPKIPVSILAGLGTVLLVASISDSSVVQSSFVPPVAGKTRVVPLVAPLVSSEPTSEREYLGNNIGMTAKAARSIQLSSAQIALKEAKVAVSLSQAQLDQARMNLIEFQAKHNNAKTLSDRGKVSRQHSDIAKAAYKLAQLQHSSASIGLQESTAQLMAAKAEVSRLGSKANTAKEM